MEEFLEKSGFKYVKNDKTIVNDFLVNESPLQISVNKTPFTTTLRTPGNDLFLSRGLLFCENIFVGKSNYFNYYSTCENGIDTFHVELEGINIETRRQLVSVSSCGLCGIESFEYPEISPLSNKETVSIQQIFNAFDHISKKQILFHKTGGSHACGLMSRTNKILSIQEDIGRHNATDKAIGESLENNILRDAYMMLVSGRISYEIVHKCFRAKIPILAAVSSPSSLAVEMSEKMGITLVAFTRDQRLTVYTHEYRIS